MNMQELKETLEKYPIQYDRQKSAFVLEPELMKVLQRFVKDVYHLKTNKKRILTKYVKKFILKAVDDMLTEAEVLRKTRKVWRN